LVLNCGFSELADLLAGITWQWYFLIKLLFKSLSRAISLLDESWVLFVRLNVIRKMLASFSIFVLLVIRLHKIIDVLSQLFYVEIIFDCRLESLRRQFLRIDVCHESSS
jgi:hypothetical protein